MLYNIVVTLKFGLALFMVLIQPFNYNQKLKSSGINKTLVPILHNNNNNRGTLVSVVSKGRQSQNYYFLVFLEVMLLNFINSLGGFSDWRHWRITPSPHAMK